MSHYTDHDDVFRYTSPYSLLISCPGGGLYRIFCPFDVLCIQSCPGCQYGTYHQVEEVKLDQSGNMLYLIKQRLYPYHIFLIIR